MQEKRVKIAYFIDRLIRGGTELQLVEQINRLSPSAVEQELFCLYKGEEHDEIHVKCKVHVLDIRKLFSRDCAVKLLRLSSYLMEHAFNTVQTYFFDSTVVGVLAGRIAGGVRVLTCRRDLGFWYSPALLMALRGLNWMTDRILVNSAAVKESVISREGVREGKIDVIPNGIQLSEFDYSPADRAKSRLELGIEDHEICIGTLTNMTRGVKRVDLFVMAATHVLAHRRDVKFLVLGDGHLKQGLIELAKQLRVSENIIFLGRTTSRHKVLAAMDIGVLTSDSEGFSNAIMEYMAAGLPVVATAVGGNKELVRHNSSGILTRRGDYKALGEAMLHLSGRSEMRSEFGEEGRRIIGKHDWGRVIDDLERYYRSQVGK